MSAGLKKSPLFLFCMFTTVMIDDNISTSKLIKQNKGAVKMKMESMAKFLIPGDIILYNRKKYEVTSAATEGEQTKIIYKNQKSNVYSIIKVKSNDFFKIISQIKLER